jgi:NAD(P)H-nitrite reductase large subunit
MTTAQCDSERTICFCHEVSHRDLLEAIGKGARTLGELQDQTLASTGCGGCEYDVIEILEAAAEASDSGQP